MDLLAPTHLLLILVVALLVLGPKRLPEAARSLGKGLRDFREAMNGYSPGHLLDDEPRVHPPEAAESELRREPPVAAATAQSAPDAEPGESGESAGDETTTPDASSGSAGADATTPSESAPTTTVPTGTASTSTDTATRTESSEHGLHDDDTQVLEGEIVPGVPSSGPGQS